MNAHVSILSDDGPDNDETMRLHIVAGDDFYLSIGPGPRHPARPSVRLCTSGARDDCATFLIAALWHYKNGNIDTAKMCAANFANSIRETS